MHKKWGVFKTHQCCKILTCLQNTSVFECLVTLSAGKCLILWLLQTSFCSKCSYIWYKQASFLYEENLGMNNTDWKNWCAVNNWWLTTWAVVCFRNQTFLICWLAENSWWQVSHWNVSNPLTLMNTCIYINYTTIVKALIQKVTCSTCVGTTHWVNLQ